MEHEFVRHKTRLALRRHSGEAALAGQWPIGEPKPRGEDFLPVREDERAPLAGQWPIGEPKPRGEDFLPVREDERAALGRTLAEGGLAEPRLADRTFGKPGLAAQMATELAAQALASVVA
jgi:hypothetical protein